MEKTDLAMACLDYSFCVLPRVARITFVVLVGTKGRKPVWDLRPLPLAETKHKILFGVNPIIYSLVYNFLSWMRHISLGCKFDVYTRNCSTNTLLLVLVSTSEGEGSGHNP